MKVYFHLNLSGFSNCYVVVNEKTNEAILIDPGEITEKIIEQIEGNNYKLVAVLITHNHGSHVNGLKTLRKIYSPKIFGAEWEIAKNNTTIITGDGKLRLAGFIVDTDYLGRGLKAQFKQADRLNDKFTCVLNSEDLDNNEIVIPNVTFAVLDEKGKVLEEITTNEKGIAETSRFALRDYSKLTLKEVKTDKWYVLNDKEIKVQLKENVYYY